MTAPGVADNEFLDLMCDVAEARLAPEKAARLQGLLLADPANYQQYVDFMMIVSGLHWSRSGRTASECGIDDPLAHSISAAVPLCAHHPSFIIHHFDVLGNVLLSYVAVAMIMGVGILAAWTSGAPDHSQQAARDPTPTALQPREPNLTTAVGALQRWPTVDGKIPVAPW